MPNTTSTFVTLSFSFKHVSLILDVDGALYSFVLVIVVVVVVVAVILVSMWKCKQIKVKDEWVTSPPFSSPGMKTDCLDSHCLCLVVRFMSNSLYNCELLWLWRARCLSPIMFCLTPHSLGQICPCPIFIENRK